MHLDRLSDADLAEIIAHYNEFSGYHALPPSWRWWYGELADLLTVEQARRKIAAAMDRDPLAYCWFGRLEPPGPGSSGQQTTTT